MSIKKNILQGIRVLDLSQFLSGPHTTLLLAGLGAEVIRVDNPKTGTALAKTPIYYGKDPSFRKRDETDLGIAFLKRCRGKKSVTIDLKSEKGHELFLKLAKESDILVENFSVGVTQRLKVDWPSLNQINQRLIYCSLTGYGSKGLIVIRKGMILQPSHVRAHECNGQAGWSSNKSRTPLQIPFLQALLIRILAALYHRESTGLGQFVDVSMIDTLFSLLFDDPIDCFEELGLNFQQGNRLVRFSPFNTYPTKDGWIVICCGTDEMWKRICEAIRKDELGLEENWSRMDWRVSNNEKVDDLLIKWTSSQLTKDALRKLEEKDVVVSPVQNINDLLNWSHLNSRGMINDVEHPQLGKLKGLKASGFPIQFSAAETGYKTPSVPSGTNNYEIFVDLLGLEESEYSKLKEESII